MSVRIATTSDGAVISVQIDSDGDTAAVIVEEPGGRYWASVFRGDELQTLVGRVEKARVGHAHDDQLSADWRSILGDGLVTVDDPLSRRVTRGRLRALKRAS